MDQAKPLQCLVAHSYGFLSENIEFASAIEGAGIAFLGPTTATMEQFSLKHTARAIAQNAKVLHACSLLVPSAAFHDRSLHLLPSQPILMPSLSIPPGARVAWEWAAQISGGGRKARGRHRVPRVAQGEPRVDLHQIGIELASSDAVSVCNALEVSRDY
jgi:hypothetical protein